MDGLEENRRKIAKRESVVTKFLVDVKKVGKYSPGVMMRKMNNRRKIAAVSHKEGDNNFAYENTVLEKRPRVVVYTCITGGYDNLLTPKIYPEGVDYVAFVDERQDESGWQMRKVPENPEKMDNVLRNRYVKFHPFELFGDKYDFAIYIDGNIEVVGDLGVMTLAAAKAETGLALHRHRQRDSLQAEAEVCKILGKGDARCLDLQVERYRKAGFPEDFGLYECNVIVSDLHNKVARKILTDWWEEFKRSKSMRDQIALPYVVWENGFEFDKIGSLGNNVYRNPRLWISEKIHEKMQKKEER